MQKLKQHPEWQDLICEYITEYGKLDGCVDVLPQKVSITTVKNALRSDHPKGLFIPEFHAKVMQAFEDYKTLHTHPSQDPDFRRDVYTQIKAMAKSGKSSTTDFVLNDQGKVIRKIHKQPWIDQWLYYVAFPKQEFTEEAILVVCANMFEDLAGAALDAMLKDALQQWLIDWKRRAIEDLQLKGTKLKYLEEHHE
jgi:hypothetical protein